MVMFCRYVFGSFTKPFSQFCFAHPKTSQPPVARTGVIAMPDVVRIQQLESSGEVSRGFGMNASINPIENVQLGMDQIPINTIFSGMNIHLPAILGFTRYQGFDPSPIEWCSAHLWQVIGDGLWQNFTWRTFVRKVQKNPKHRKKSGNSRVSTLLLVISFNVGQIPVTRCFLAK